MNDRVRAGGCLCGAVRFTVRGKPIRAGLCHCLDCRKSSGSAFTLFAVWPRAAFSCTGELATFGRRSFCPACGSRIGEISDDEAEIMIGSLDEAPSDLVPDYELWTPRREAWLHALPWADQFSADQDGQGGDWRQPIGQRQL